MDVAAMMERDGFALVPDVLDEVTVRALLAALEDAGGDAPRGVGVRRRASVYAMRNLLDVPAVRNVAKSAAVRALAEAVIGPGAFAVRGILFDKTPDANWKVAWHQDLTIAVRERREVEGFVPWSEKAGVSSVQPPASVLERMITVRLHLDDCFAENGPVNVIPGSHRHGRLSPAQTERLRAESAPVPTCIARGGALVMRPLLLHASSPATSPAHRRVVHLDFAVDPLPGGLEWHVGPHPLVASLPSPTRGRGELPQ
jgi:ectoine hydroxylase-related dioxygenase (phytanoyl-CoA dioxygenase family)